MRKPIHMVRSYNDYSWCGRYRSDLDRGYGDPRMTKNPKVATCYYCRVAIRKGKPN